MSLFDLFWNQDLRKPTNDKSIQIPTVNSKVDDGFNKDKTEEGNLSVQDSSVLDESAHSMHKDEKDE